MVDGSLGPVLRSHGEAAPTVRISNPTIGFRKRPGQHTAKQDAVSVNDLFHASVSPN